MYVQLRICYKYIYIYSGINDSIDGIMLKRWTPISVVHRVKVSIIMCRLDTSNIPIDHSINHHTSIEVVA